MINCLMIAKGVRNFVKDCDICEIKPICKEGDSMAKKAEKKEPKKKKEEEKPQMPGYGIKIEGK